MNWKSSCFVLFGAPLAILVASGCGGNVDASQSVDGGRAVFQATTAEGRVFIPETSIEQPGDVGVRVHTNHLIFVPSGSESRGRTPTGLSPAQVRAAYSVPSTGGSGVIAVVAAYHFPTALNDFNVFSRQFGLPTENSTSPTSPNNKVFQVVYASGTQPPSNVGWAQEMALDIEWAHAMAPNAKIVLVEASSANASFMMQAEKVARALPGVRQVSNSWGGTEAQSLHTVFNKIFVQPGVTFFAASGDTGGQPIWPALASNVVAVGGTTLRMNGTTYVDESAWSGAGCGISKFEPRPAFQSTVSTKVGNFRGTADIAAVADPATGVSVYISYGASTAGGWLVFGGTSVACPVIAGIANSAGSNRSSSQDQTAKFYSGIGSASFRDVKTGRAGSFSAGLGWDFPTGVGTPNGLAGF